MTAAKAKEDLLVPLDNYLSAGIHIGTKFRTKSMKPYIYKVNPAGLAIIDVQQINERLKVIAEFLARYDPKEILVIGRRENSWKAIKKFAKATGINYYTGRYPAGILTNPELETYAEPKIILVTDPWPDKNSIQDSMRIGIPIVSLCDTNNTTQNIDLIVPCNNKGAKSLGLIFWILANEYLRARKEIPKGKSINIPLEEFSE